MASTRSFELFADYFQFYIQDESSDGDLSNAWTDQATADLVALAPGVIGVGTARNMDVPVTIEIHDAEPSLSLDAWDQVAECDIAVPSGKLIVAGCTDYLRDAARISVPSGQYRARLLYAGLNTLSADGLDGADHYTVQLWRAPAQGLRILKRDAAPPRGGV